MDDENRVIFKVSLFWTLNWHFTLHWIIQTLSEVLGLVISDLSVCSFH
jgi:hypothetical protein